MPRLRRQNQTSLAIDHTEHMFDTGCVEGWRAEQQRQQTNAWSPGQRILNGTGARMPEHRLDPPVPITARIVWEDDGEEHLDTATGPAIPTHLGVAGSQRRYTPVAQPHR
jgi:hypothetical protein